MEADITIAGHRIIHAIIFCLKGMQQLQEGAKLLCRRIQQTATPANGSRDPADSEYGIRTELEQHVHEHCNTSHAYCVTGTASGAICYCDGKESTFMPDIMNSNQDNWILDCRVNNGTTRLTRGHSQKDCKHLEEAYESAKRNGRHQRAKKKDERNWTITDIV